MKGKSEVSNFIGERVSIKLEGFKPEKLLSQAAAKGVRIRNVVYKDETEIHLTVSREGVDTLKKLAGSTHRLTVIERRGARVRAYRMKKSKMTIAGICLFAFFSAQSLFVREIKVIGCKSITESSIREAIAEEGLYEGARRNFDCDAIERMLFETFDEIVWARVAYDGGYAEVHISESRQAPVSEEKTGMYLVILWQRRTVTSKEFILTAAERKRQRMILCGKGYTNYRKNSCGASQLSC